MKVIARTYLIIAFCFTQLCSAEFPGAEHLVFNMYYMKMQVATIEFQLSSVEKNHQEIFLQVKAVATPWAEKFFPVDNFYSVVLQRANFLPLFIRKQIKQKNVAYQRVQQFDHELNIAKVDSNYTYPIPENCYDYFSLLYYLRFGDIPDSTQIFLDGEALILGLTIQFNDKETKVSVPAGDFSAQSFAIHINKLNDKKRPWKTDLLTNRLTKPGSDIQIFLSNDDRRLPLKISYQNSWTRTELKLVKYN